MGIGALVTGLIFFFWQFLSWSMLNVHAAEFQYSPNQDKIIEALNEHITEDGSYMIPGLPPDASGAEHEQFMADMESKPWARVEYHKAYHVNMPLNLLRGFVLNFVTGLLMIWMLMNYKENNFMKTLLTSLAVGAIGYMNFPYLNSIWFEGNTIGYIVDVLVAWGLSGAFLGWWLNR